MDYEAFVEEYEKLSSINLKLYEENQMKRRVNTYIERKSLSGYEEFIGLLHMSKREQDVFKDYITINVTEFFRTPDQWQFFVENALADVIQRHTDELKIWSMASSTGEEPYSIAMSVIATMEEPSFHLIATDIDERVLSKAREGRYCEEVVLAIPKDIRERFFLKEKENHYISDGVKKHIDFIIFQPENPWSLDRGFSGVRT